MLAVAAASAVTYALTATLRSWMPNVATGAFFVAVTITVVERAIRRERRQRLQPRVEYVLDRLRWDLRSFLESLVVDYSGTHLGTFKPVPRDAIAFLDFWLVEKEHQDACHTPLEDSPLPLVLHAGFECANALRRSRDNDREVMEAELVRAIDDYWWHAGQGELFYGFSRAQWTHDPAGNMRHAEEVLVRGARKFAEALLPHDTRGRIEFEDLTLQAAEEHSRGMRERGWYYEDMAAQMRARGGHG
jgi:hypothetical protein